MLGCKRVCHHIHLLSMLHMFVFIALSSATMALLYTLVVILATLCLSRLGFGHWVSPTPPPTQAWAGRPRPQRIAGRGIVGYIASSGKTHPIRTFNSMTSACGTLDNRPGAPGITFTPIAKVTPAFLHVSDLCMKGKCKELNLMKLGDLIAADSDCDWDCVSDCDQTSE